MSGTGRRVIGVVQPSYLPWLPFFERMAASDVFVLLDDVEYSKNSFFNRNAIKNAQGRQLLTVPVLYKGNSSAAIRDIRINEAVNWRIKHRRAIEQAYARAPYWPLYRDRVCAIFQTTSDRLIDIVVPLIELMREAFEIRTPVHMSSSIGATGSRNEKLVNICKYLDGRWFIVKPGTGEYHPREEFAPSGIDFAYLRYSSVTYPQLHGPFEPGLSALDYLLNCGPGRPPFSARCSFDEETSP